MEGRLFGTDGIRGRAGEGWLAEGPASAVGRAAGLVLARGRAGLRAVTGHDGRRSGPALEAAVARGLAQAGFSVTSAGLATTPCVALAARLAERDAAVVISASHNPACDNGIKLFGAGGAKLSDEAELEIERRLAADPAPAPAGPPPPRDPRLVALYADALAASVPDLDLTGFELVVDGANGGGSELAPAVLARLGARVHRIACAPDGENINAGCGATDPRALRREVLARSAHAGVALDGDGDRCILCDERGGEVGGDAVLAVCGLDLARRGRLASGQVVATVMSNRGLARALRPAGVRLRTVGVGDRRVVEALREGGLELGGEQSGHVVFGADHHYVGDGIYTALRVLDVVRRSGRPLSELASVYQPLPQVLVNARVARKPPLEELASVGAAVRALEEELGEDGRVLLRYSGTEALVRVMVEGPDEELVRARAEALAAVVTRAIEDGR